MTPSRFFRPFSFWIPASSSRKFHDVLRVKQQKKTELIEMESFFFCFRVMDISSRTYSNQHFVIHISFVITLDKTKKYILPVRRNKFRRGIMIPSFRVPLINADVNQTRDLYSTVYIIIVYYARNELAGCEMQVQLTKWLRECFISTTVLGSFV